MNNLKDIHNASAPASNRFALFYQDFNEQFEGYTQLRTFFALYSRSCSIRISMNNLKDIHNGLLYGTCSANVVLSGFQ